MATPSTLDRIRHAVEALQAAGFTSDDNGRQYLQDLSGEMQDGGPYEVLAHLSKGEYSVTFEQTTHPEPDSDGGSSVRTHPPVAVVCGPNESRVAANPTDTQLILALVGAESEHSLTP